MLEESPLVLRGDLGKLAQELATHLNRQGRAVLNVQVQVQPPLAEEKALASSARADAQVRFHELQHRRMDLKVEQEVGVAVEQVAMVNGPAIKKRGKIIIMSIGVFA